MYQRQNQGAQDEDDRFPDDVNAAFSDPNHYISMYYFIKKDTYCKKTWLGLAREVMLFLLSFFSFSFYFVL